MAYTTYNLDLLDFDFIDVADDGKPVAQTLTIAEVEERMESLQYQLEQAHEVSKCLYAIEQELTGHKTIQRLKNHLIEKEQYISLAQRQIAILRWALYPIDEDVRYWCLYSQELAHQMVPEAFEGSSDSGN